MHAKNASAKHCWQHNATCARQVALPLQRGVPNALHWVSTAWHFFFCFLPHDWPPFLASLTSGLATVAASAAPPRVTSERLTVHGCPPWPHGRPTHPRGACRGAQTILNYGEARIAGLSMAERRSREPWLGSVDRRTGPTLAPWRSVPSSGSTPIRAKWISLPAASAAPSPTRGRPHGSSATRGHRRRAGGPAPRSSPPHRHTDSARSGALPGEGFPPEPAGGRNADRRACDDGGVLIADLEQPTSRATLNRCALFLATAFRSLRFGALLSVDHARCFSWCGLLIDFRRSSP
jgi:hypothetical protein